MNVPLFPRPPAVRGVETPLSDAPDVATLSRSPTSLLTVPRVRGRHAVPLRSFGTGNQRRRTSRNLVHPWVKDATVKDAARRHVTEFRVRMTEHCARNDEGDDNDDVVCGVDITDTPTTISTEISPHLKNGVIRTKWTKSVAIQTIEGLPLRLRALPSLRDIEEDNGNSLFPQKSSRFWKHLRFLGRLSLSQFGLLWLLVIWTVAGAAAFSATEGPREREQVVSLKNLQKDLAVGLATELRQLRAEQDQDVEPLWSDKVRQYVGKHEELLLVAVSSGYGEGGNSGQLWTFPGCVLFAISLITTLGFGAPVPRTTAGRTVGLIFAAIGIPAHFLLVLNFGLMVALRLKRYAIARQGVQLDNAESSYSTQMPRWVKVLLFVCSVAYYILGILCFGIARSRPIEASVLFPLDFTAAGGLSTIVGHVRILYGLYLEGAVTIAAIVVALLRVSATQSLTNIGLKYGLLIEVKILGKHCMRLLLPIKLIVFCRKITASPLPVAMLHERRMVVVAMRLRSTLLKGLKAIARKKVFAVSKKRKQIDQSQLQVFLIFIQYKKNYCLTMEFTWTWHTAISLRESIRKLNLRNKKMDKHTQWDNGPIFKKGEEQYCVLSISGTQCDSDSNVAVLDKTSNCIIFFVLNKSLRPVKIQDCKPENHGTDVLGIKFSNFSKDIYYIGTQESITMYDQRMAFEIVETFETSMEGGKLKSINCFDINCNGKYIAAGTELTGGDAFILFWDIRYKKKKVHHPMFSDLNFLGGYWESHTDDITSLIFHPVKPATLASGSTDGLINIYDLRQSSEDQALTYSLNTESSVARLGWLTNRFLWCSTYAETLQFWNCECANPFVTLERKDLAIFSDENPDDCYVVKVHTSDHPLRFQKFALTGSSTSKRQYLRCLFFETDSKEPDPLLENKQVVRDSWLHEKSETLVTVGEGNSLDVWKLC
ncbi:uncharacterized protein [Linepithema humile]|uniref:uncharacterized protein n=1 Tax=Linepithema humile TaxID=83485 RepID=UPI00351F47B4